MIRSYPFISTLDLNESWGGGSKFERDKEQVRAGFLKFGVKLLGGGLPTMRRNRVAGSRFLQRHGSWFHRPLSQEQPKGDHHQEVTSVMVL